LSLSNLAGLLRQQFFGYPICSVGSISLSSVRRGSRPPPSKLRFLGERLGQQKCQTQRATTAKVIRDSLHLYASIYNNLAAVLSFLSCYYGCFGKNSDIGEARMCDNAFQRRPG
jgi:hypothetical protein